MNKPCQDDGDTQTLEFLETKQARHIGLTYFREGLRCESHVRARGMLRDKSLAQYMEAISTGSIHRLRASPL